MSKDPRRTLAFIDGFEDEVARLIVDGTVRHIDRALLPATASEGTWVAISVTPAKAPAGDSEALRDAATRSDRGEDLKL